MKKLKIFERQVAMSSFQEDNVMDAMTAHINQAIALWVQKENIKSYEVINSQLTAMNMYEIGFSRFTPCMVLSVHLVY
ncbi:hypothetical protein BCY91_13690 [Pelobium manganitolerans]|uniref:Uncharacterized protein n=1 Tax=Pelobium manganitolerans TaxID=1842495 RepID=A0A419SAZ9_9SPHI|nr:hypothetical protein [Pelobium manganitolerans]RKD19631.1 hypothetical protein BCY91_13690 [Pelobium manganitolerans]